MERRVGNGVEREVRKHGLSAARELLYVHSSTTMQGTAYRLWIIRDPPFSFSAYHEVISNVVC
jgi:hypothetical protein